MAITKTLLALALMLLLACTSQPPLPKSDHYDGEHFHNLERFEPSLGSLWRYYWEKPKSTWQVRPAPVADAVVPVVQDLRLTVIGHATALIQIDGVNVITDPIFSERASPVQWAGPKRFVPPALSIEQLPRIDAVLISHNHFDHLDEASLRALEARFQPVYLVGLRGGQTLADMGIDRTRIVELDWNQSHTVRGLKISAQAAKHWSKRGLFDQNQSLWLAFVLHGHGGPVYFSGDTGYGNHFADTFQRFGAMRAALLPIGAYEPRWLTAYQHTDPAEAVQAHQDLHSGFSLGLHYGTFELSSEGQDQPISDLAAALQKAGIPPERFVAAGFGRGYVPSPPACTPIESTPNPPTPCPSHPRH
jgi:L-ascorbate metabolism protein UlaG (beta-lactamase superfamily)